ncbi:MAG: nitroreductase family deazaflavin-dependent oxidoreductase [Actinobacteria bacterium]|nr:nitroreductase family deazaflavin-dependent oxidoreductase [Actinomycetota bacterium]
MATADDLAAHRDEDYCYLTTRGRVSGRPHEIEIWFALRDTTLYLLSGAGDGTDGPRADWVRNLRADPAVTVRLGPTTCDAVARVVAPGTAEDAFARAAVFGKYAPHHADLEDWRQRALPVALDVIGPQS